jgi:hypothetical protein
MLDKVKDLTRFLLDRIGLDIVRSSTQEDFHQFLSLLQPHKSKFSLVRVGGQNDGGYLIPDDLEGLDAIYSPGVAASSDFEAYFASQGLRCFLADNSVDSPPIHNDKIIFEKKHIGLSTSGYEMTLENWVLRNTPHSTNLVLQMDIEGSEWAVLTHAPESILTKFRIVVVEFHNLHRIFNSEGLASANLALTKLLQFFEIVHLHPNNGGGYIRFRNKQVPRVIEITFIRKDRVVNLEPTTIFPHKLDAPNLPNLRDFYLSTDLFKK